MRLDLSGTFGFRTFDFCLQPHVLERLRRIAHPTLVAALILVAFPSAAQTNTEAKPPDPPAIKESPWDAPEPWRTDRWFLETSLYTRHYSYDPAHDDHQNLILVEYNFTENWLIGGSVFNNSFGQSSQFVYGAYRVRPLEKVQELYLKLGVGVIHGYRGQYQDKIPFNNSGFAPGIVPSVGYCVNRFCSELILFGTAGFIVSFGVTIP